MSNVPDKYRAEITGYQWSKGPVAQFATIRAARDWAESYGSEADRCTITDKQGREVALHVRNGSSSEWYRAEPSRE